MLASLNWLDWTLIATLLFFTALSARRGFSREIIGLAATIIGLVLAMWFYGTAGSFLLPYVSSARLANLIGFLIVVFSVMILGGMLGWIVSRFLKTIGLSFFDRLLGAAFGFVKGLVVCVTLLTAFIAFAPAGPAPANSAPDGAVHDKSIKNPGGFTQSTVVHSQIAPYVLEASHYAVAIAPMELKSSFQKQYAGVKSALTSSQVNNQDQ